MSEVYSVPKRIATWNPARGVWETTAANLFCEHSELYSETWPTSGMTVGGRAFARPMSAPPTSDTGSSSLPTPEAKLASSGPDYARANRTGSGGDDLTTTVAKMLPTPTSRDGKGRNQRNDDTCLPGAILGL